MLNKTKIAYSIHDAERFVKDFFRSYFTEYEDSFRENAKFPGMEIITECYLFGGYKNVIAEELDTDSNLFPKEKLESYNSVEAYGVDELLNDIFEAFVKDGFRNLDCLLRDLNKPKDVIPNISHACSADILLGIMLYKPNSNDSYGSIEVVFKANNQRDILDYLSEIEDIDKSYSYAESQDIIEAVIKDKD